MNDTLLLCTFTLDDRLFGVDVRRVQEVLRRQDMTRVPLASRFIRGLINLRGQIVMAIDLRCCLDLGETPIDSDAMHLVLRTDDGSLSFLVDRIHDVVVVEPSTFEPPPSNLQGEMRTMILGSYSDVDRLLLALDADAVLTMIDPPAGAAAPTH
ncbi:MAG: chemotaxis protein CheW [Isosphaeraceae bacterium]|nr:chemotaxis protein CheW [Isosphaeraceae bacterium]